MNSPSENEQYNLVFRGVLAKGVALELAKRNLGHLFKIDANKVEALFTGKAVVLKRGLSLELANKYRVAIKKAGALVDVELQPAEVKRDNAKASYAVPEVKKKKKPGMIPGTEAEAAPSEQGASAFSLAPVGADLLLQGEKTAVEAVDVDTSALSIKDQSGNLLNSDEYVAEQSVSPDLTDFELADPGADVLRPEERKQHVQKEVDLSALSLGAPGSKLSPDKPAPPPAPDVSKISLADEG